MNMARQHCSTSNAYTKAPRFGARYITARQEEERYQRQLIFGAKLWRTVVFGLALVILLMSVAMVQMYRSRREIPYVYLVDESGFTAPIGPAKEVAQESHIQFALRDFIRLSRGVTIDSFALEDYLRRAYLYVEPGSAAYRELRSYHMTELKPFELARSRSVFVHNISFLPVDSKYTWQAKWKETARDIQGNKIGERWFWGRFTIKLTPPKAAELRRENPWGLQIIHLTWAEQNV